MNPWVELDRQTPELQSWQLLLMLVFLLGYVGSIGSLLSGRARVRAALTALAAGVALCLLSSPWVVGALMLALAVGVVGLFAGVVALLGRMLDVDRHVAAADLAVSADEAPEPSRRALAHPAAAEPLTVT